MLPIVIVSLILTSFVVSGQQTCNLQQFQNCQTAFSTKLGVPTQTPADWHNPTALAFAIQNIFANGLAGWTNGLVGICNGYNGLIQCLGPMAPACINPYFLLSNDNSPTNAYGYMMIMNAIAFDCGAGFYPAINNWPCIQRVYQHYNDTLFGCVQSFMNNVFHDPDNACDYLQTGLSCLTAPFQALCAPPGKWFGCETWRVFLATRFYTCPAQCSVSKLKVEEDYFNSHPEWKSVQPYGSF
jgi:hypothetical protein